MMTALEQDPIQAFHTYNVADLSWSHVVPSIVVPDQLTRAQTVRRQNITRLHRVNTARRKQPISLKFYRKEVHLAVCFLDSTEVSPGRAVSVFLTTDLTALILVLRCLPAG